MLKLEPVKEEEADRIAADEQGQLIHLFLEEFFKKITNNGKKSLPLTFPAEAFETEFEERFPHEFGPLHPILWEATRILIKENLRLYLEEHFNDLREEELTPTYFEELIETKLDAPLDKPTWVGIMDRIDVGEAKARVLDYKSGKIVDGKVATASLRGLKAQPPLYILMAERFFKEKGKNIETISFAYNKVLGNHQINSLSPDDWQKNKDGIIRTLKFQLDQIEKGTFLPMPGDWCRSCDVAPICRKHHSISTYRAKQGPGEKLWQLRKLKAK